MTKNERRPPVGGDSEPLNVETLERLVLETARDDVPPEGARARLLASSALRLPLSERPRSPLSKLGTLTGRGGQMGGLALLVGAAVATAAFVSTTREESRLHPSSASSAASHVATQQMPAASLVGAAAPPAAPAETLPEPPADATAKRPPEESVATKLAAARATAERAPARSRTLPASTASADPARAERDVHEKRSTLDREIARMSTVRAALATGDTVRALELLDAYDAEFPSGAFAVDVAVLRIETLAQSGRTAEARRLGARFVAQHPESASARRVTHTLDRIAPPNDAPAVAPSSE